MQLVIRVAESESESVGVGGFRKESESEYFIRLRLLMSNSLRISDVNARASGVQYSNLFKRTLPRIARHSVRLIKSLHFNL